MNYSMDERLAFSRGVREKSDLKTLQNMIAGCRSVVKTNGADDRAGIDYIVTLRRGAQILIDAKARDKGAKRNWRNGPEFALEIWSVIEKKISGWTLNENKNTDFILFTFDPSEETACYLVSFQLLRMAFVKNFRAWTAHYRRAKQNSGRWHSECVFIPASVVEVAVLDVSHGSLM